MIQSEEGEEDLIAVRSGSRLLSDVYGRVQGGALLPRSNILNDLKACF